jgi:hypothetical protein
MILIVLFLAIAGIFSVIFVTWWALAKISRWTEKVDLGKETPLFGSLSVLLPILGAIAIILGIESDTGQGEAVAVIFLFTTPLGGPSFAIAGLASRERFAVVPIAGLFLNGLFVVHFWLRL